MKDFAVGSHVAGWGRAWDMVMVVQAGPLQPSALKHFWGNRMHPAPILVLELKLHQLNFG